METLAYLHLALAYETPADKDCTAKIATPERPKLLNWLAQQKLSTSAAIQVVGLTVALGFSGMASKALALVQQGDNGQEVTALQQRLAKLGYFKGNVTGRFGSATKEAVIKFQKDKGLKADGVVGDSTEASLGESEQPESKPESENSRSDSLVVTGARGDQVANIQKKLVAAGFAVGEKGVFDEITEDAVRQFQQAKGLKVDGIVGPQTLAALPAVSKSNSKKAPAKTHLWYEDKSAPLAPFIKKQN